MNSVNIAYADDLVKEYLLFRGFVKTANQFDVERKTNRLKGFQAGKIVEQLFHHINSYNVVALLDLWDYLSRNFFARLDKDFSFTVKKLDLSLKRYYIVHCVSTGHLEKMEEFFEQCSAELIKDPEWRPWFALRYIRNPMSDPNFEVFFTKSWLETFTVSLHNFLTTIFQSVPLPRMLLFDSERALRKALEAQVESLQGEVRRQKEFIEANASQIERLKRRDREALQQQQQQQEEAPRAIDAGIPVVSQSPPPRSSDVGKIPPNWPRTSDDTEDQAQQAVVVQKQDILSGHTAPILRVRFSAEGSLLASGSSDGMVKIWSTNPMQSRQGSVACNAEVTALSWETKAEKLLLIGCANGKLRIWNAQLDKVVAELTVPTDHTRIEDAAFSPSSSSFVTASNCPDRPDDGVLTVWNLKTLKAEVRVQIDPPSCVKCIGFNHNGSLLLAGTTDGMIRLYDMASCTAIMGWKAHEGGVLCTRFSHDETWLLSLGADGKLLRWSANGPNRCEFTYEYEGGIFSENGVLRAADISIDTTGQLFAVPSRAGTAIYHEAQAKPVQTLGGHSKPVACVDWCGTLIASGAADQICRLTRLNHY